MKNQDGDSPYATWRTLLALAAVAATCIWISWPLWSATEVAFGSMVGDNVETPWFYDQMARSLLSGQGLTYLHDFNYPSPVPRITDFPSVLDAVLVSPLAWFLDWPRQYGAAQGLVILVNGLGLGLLARALGCSGPGILIAGALGAFCPPAWREIWLGRMNAAWPGLSAGAMACWLFLFTPAPSWKGWLQVGIAAVLGALAVAIYPPLPLFLAPVGIGFALCRTRNWRAWVRPLLAVGIGLALAYPPLQEMRESPKASMPVCAAGSWRGMCHEGTAASPAHMGSPYIYELGFPLSAWGGIRPGETALLPLNDGVALGSWVLGILALFHRRYRLAAGIALAYGAGLAFLAMGPCPTWNGTTHWDPRGLPVVGWLIDRAWCTLGVIHDYGRLGTAAVTIGAVLSGLGADAITRLRPRLGPILGLLVAIAAGVHAGQFALARVQDGSWWAPIPELDTTPILSEISTGPVAELPFDRHGIFLSILEAPELQRVNPFNPSDPPPDRKKFHAWLYALGQGEILTPLPSAQEAQQSGIAWIVFDPSRCEVPFTAKARACSPTVPGTLSDILGPPTRQSDAVKAWQLANNQ